MMKKQKYEAGEDNKHACVHANGVADEVETTENEEEWCRADGVTSICVFNGFSLQCYVDLIKSTRATAVLFSLSPESDFSRRFVF